MKKTIVKIMICGMLAMGFWANVGKALSDAGDWLYEHTAGAGLYI